MEVSVLISNFLIIVITVRNGIRFNIGLCLKETSLYFVRGKWFHIPLIHNVNSHVMKKCCNCVHRGYEISRWEYLDQKFSDFFKHYIISSAKFAASVVDKKAPSLKIKLFPWEIHMILIFWKLIWYFDVTRYYWIHIKINIFVRDQTVVNSLRPSDAYMRR